MPHLSHRPELVDPLAYIAPGANVLGDVHLAAECSVWFAAVVRGDSETIRIGAGTNVQDGCILHADAGVPCTLGAGVTVGHGAVVHGCTVEDNAMIGIRAVVLNHCRVGTGSIIGAGAVLPEGTVIPPHSIVLGVPGEVVREANERDRERIRHAAAHYVDLARRCRDAA